MEQYVGVHADSPDWTEQRQENAQKLLVQVNALEESCDFDWPINPATKSQVSGQTYGGFRPQDCPQGAPHSSHKEGLAVDVYDPQNTLDGALTDEILEQFELYREAPQSTPHWCHLTIRPPGSGKRTFQP